MAWRPGCLWFEGMNFHRYPASTIAGDYCRAGIGVALTSGTLIFLNPIRGITYVLVPLAILFVLFGGRNVLRHMTRYEVTEYEIRAAGPTRAEITWANLEGVELRYYSTRRDRSRGWMQLKLKSAENTIRLDSTLQGFSDIVARAVDEAAVHSIALSGPTQENVRALGIGGLSESIRLPTVS